MRSLVWTAPKQMQIREEAEPVLPEGWILVSVERVGICGSDISGFLGHNELRKPPLVMGHEFSGTVVKLGAGVPREWMNRLVTVNPILSCGNCRPCRSGNRQICLNRKIIGIDYPGGFADLVSVPMSSCLEIREAATGALVEPLACGVRAASLSKAEPGDYAIIIGAGTIGLTTLLMVKQRGVRKCLVLDTNPSRLHWATNWGATKVANPRVDDVASLVKSDTDGDGADCVIDAVGFSDTRAQSVSLLRRGGRAVWIGLHENMSNVPGNVIVRFENEIVGSFSYSDDDFRRAVILANTGFIETTSGWLDTRSLDKGQESFEEQASPSPRYSKVLLDPSK